jgi:hypothetical protein
MVNDGKMPSKTMRLIEEVDTLDGMQRRQTFYSWSSKMSYVESPSASPTLSPTINEVSSWPSMAPSLLPTLAQYEPAADASGNAMMWKEDSFSALHYALVFILVGIFLCWVRKRRMKNNKEPAIEALVLAAMSGDDQDLRRASKSDVGEIELTDLSKTLSNVEDRLDYVIMTEEWDEVSDLEQSQITATRHVLKDVLKDMASERRPS